MAVDEALLESTALSANATLRFYRWSEPTLSLGYFQRLEDRHLHAESKHCPVIRRATGGGAILHDHELTYSLVLPREDLSARQKTEQLYSHVHTGIVAALAGFGVDAQVYLPTSACSSNNPPFLCFKHLTSGDVVIAGHKVAGSAQRRRGGAVLQHGSILLAQSAAAPQLSGICEIAKQHIDADELAERLLAQLGKNLSLTFAPSELADAETERARHIEHNRYLSVDWTSRR